MPPTVVASAGHASSFWVHVTHGEPVGVWVRLEDGSVRVPLRERQGVIARAVRQLDDAGVAIDDIAIVTPTLDDVFLQLTGHAAEEDESA